MGAAFSIRGTRANTDEKTTLYVIQPSAPTKRLLIYETIIGSKSSPADAQCGYRFQRLTDDTPSTDDVDVTPVELDPGVGAASCRGVAAPVVEPTYTAGKIPLSFPLNQRNTYRWVATPRREIVVPAQGSNGLGVISEDPTAAFNVEAVLQFEE